ncbi:uncharacterized protein LOC117290147 [Asterias rubens]|uniref:uncharacterized protein LOC117290147 n=1 Tax=Asterias rubens TaxID=7604 RepID=UPI0014555032|nr:uncharacterized protein LOC117290147 [Asterias rubens]
MLHRSEDCHKFRSCKDTGDFGVHDDICTCDWRPGLVHRPGQVAVPEFRAPSHRGPRIPLAGWFGSLPASRSPSTRVNGRVVNSPRKQSTTDQRKSPQRPSAKSGSSCFNGDLRVGGKWKFRHRTEAKSHMEDYREKFALRLVGVDGGPVVDSSEFGKNLPDPYANKSDDYRRMYNRLHDFLMKRPRARVTTSTSVIITPQGYDRSNENPATREISLERENQKKRFEIYDQIPTNFSGLFSPPFRRPKDITFRPFLSCSAEIQRTNKFMRNHVADEKRSGSLPDIYKAAEGVRFPLPNSAAQDHKTCQGDSLSSSPDQTGVGVASETDIRRLEPKPKTETGGKKRPEPKSQIFVKTTAGFDASMVQFIKNAKQNLEEVRERRIRKEALARSRLVTHRGQGNDLVVTSEKERLKRSTSQAVKETRRIKLGISQS